MAAGAEGPRRTRRSIDVELELRRRIKVAAAPKDLTVREYLEAIRPRAIEADEQAVGQERTAWSRLSAGAFARDWDSEEDAASDQPASG
ncbi:MAG: hypothetical protein HYY04_10050 [Chloroflexi bacterium]|nr:hypothetical protein [Chloroflexota bacterium]